MHAMRMIFNEVSAEGVLLVDATNDINRQAALHNIGILCPSLAQIINNTKQSPVRLIMPGSGEILSTDVTTQGDPLAMGMYAIAVTPIIRHLRSFYQTVQQVWYADDAAGAGSCDNLKMWWDELNRIGPLYGYYPNASKTCLIVKPHHGHAASEIFLLAPE